MSHDGDDSGIPFNPVAFVGGLLGDTTERWRSRLAMLRGVFVKEPIEQFGRIASVIRHFDAYREVDRALFYHRFASNLLLAREIGLFAELADGPMGADELAGRCGVDPAAVRSILRLLEAQDVVVRTDEGQFESTAFARTFFDRHSSTSLIPLLDIGATYAQSFPDMLEGIRNGERPALLDVFDDECRTDELLDGVNAYIDQAGRELISRVDWPDVRHLIVGSMGVSFSSLILEAFPEARVTYGCLPHLVERIPRLRREYGVDPDRVVETHPHGGEPFEDKWGREAFDLVFLTKKMILDPANDLGEKFAQKTHRVLNPGGVAVFWETIHEDDKPTPVGRAMETFLDLGVSPTAPVLTREGFRRRLRDIGFVDIEVVSCMEDTTTFVVARVES